MSVLDGPRDERRRIFHEGLPVWVRVDGERLVLPDGRSVAEKDATYLAPCDPTKILCIHLNYDSRRIEFKAPALTTPTYFQKPTTALNVHRGKLNRPADCQYLNYEGEVAAIIGKPMRNVSRDEVWDCLAGFAPANDVGAHDFRDTDSGSMLRVKGQDGFCPIGPGIVRGVDIRRSTLKTFVNGKVVQDTAVADMTFGIDYLLADLARHITFLPGDIVLTGTPAFSRPMFPGDSVEVEVSGIGRLSNTVQETPAPSHRIGHQPTDSAEVRRVALGSSGAAS
ncbi:MAG: fumarylacetoacetate hydrolase family protein [Rhizomicrobium sp.]